jgi:predicted RNA-binding Zn-ribbon protein involved in translation (DUF1610 family)
MSDHDVLLAIQELLDEVEWTPNTLELITHLLDSNDARIRLPAGLCESCEHIDRIETFVRLRCPHCGGTTITRGEISRSPEEAAKSDARVAILALEGVTAVQKFDAIVAIENGTAIGQQILDIVRGSKR